MTPRRTNLQVGRIRQNKAQIERSFVMIMTIIVIAVVAYVGYRGAAYLIGFQGQQQYQEFWNGLDSQITSHSNYGAYKNLSVILPNGNNYLCFFNLSIDIARKKEDGRYLPDDDALNYWKAARPADDNVLLSSGKTQRINNIGFENGANYTCYKGSAFSIIINGEGNLAVLS